MKETILNLLEILNNNSGGLQALFSGLLVIANIIYIYINSKMHNEMIKTRERYERPNINLRLEKAISGAYYNLIVENISNVPAKNIKFIEYPRFNIVDNMNSEDIGFIKEGINYMGANQTHQTFFIDITNLTSDENIDNNIHFKIKYENIEGEKFSLDTNFNLLAYKHRLSFGKPFEERLLKNLSGIKDVLDSKK